MNLEMLTTSIPPTSESKTTVAERQTTVAPAEHQQPYDGHADIASVYTVYGPCGSSICIHTVGAPYVNL